MRDLPTDVLTKLMTFLHETNGELQVIDMPGLVNFAVQHGEQYPILFNLFQVNKQTVLENFHQTGEVPAGVKLIRTATHEGSNVTELEVIRGPRASKS